VTFVNKDPEFHAVGGVAGTFGDMHRDIASEERVRITFEEEGIFPYVCILHPGMGGGHRRRRRPGRRERFATGGSRRQDEICLFERGSRDRARGRRRGGLVGARRRPRRGLGGRRTHHAAAQIGVRSPGREQLGGTSTHDLSARRRMQRFRSGISRPASSPSVGSVPGSRRPDRGPRPTGTASPGFRPPPGRR
jgi:hypothetical protein